MPISDEQKQAALKELETHLGKDTPAFIENLTETAADEGVYGDDVYECLIKSLAFIKDAETLIDEKALPAAILRVLQHVDDTDPREGKNWTSQ